MMNMYVMLMLMFWDVNACLTPRGVTTLKKEINELTHALGKAYGGEGCLLMCLGRQRASLYKEGLSYTPRKARRPLLLTRLVLRRIMVGFTLVASKLVT
jgi:hypothetical protein